MKRVLLMALAFSFAAGPAIAAEDFARIGHHRESRAFWMNDTQAFPNRTDRDAKPAAPRFTTTYMDGIARRFGPTSGHLDFFSRQLGGSAGPALAGTVDGGAAKLVLRWHPGD